MGSVRWPGGRCARRATGERALASIPPCQVPGPPHIPRPRPVPWRHHPSALSHHGGRGGDGGGDGGCGARGGRAGEDLPPEPLPPGTPVQAHDKSVVEEPCSSGWCLKILEGRDKNFGDDDFGIATERQCLQRPPSDNQERCAYVKQNHKRKFMCFCKGDLCNSANNNPPVSLLLLLVMPLIMLAH